jgi:ribosomal protein S18 acetylase RimI-like enzyme
MAGIRYQCTLDDITSSQLGGFFVGWPNPPNAQTLLEILRGSYRIWLAVETTSGRVVGFINSISDGILSAFIPLLEVLPDFKNQGVGTVLVERLVADLSHLYSTDLLCDVELQPFYERLGLRRATGMLVRNYANQSGSGAEY